MSYFIGGTFNHTRTDWLFFTSYGALLTTTHHQTKFGNQYLYQGGFGRTFANFKKWIVDWIVEIDGTFYEKNKVNGKMDPNSGGNVIYLTPSIWASTMHWTLQFGIGYAIQQHLFGDQNRYTYLIASSFGWTF